MKENKVCRVCGYSLFVGENITQYRIDTHNYICRSCNREYSRLHQNEYLYRIGRHQPMSENRECASFLGIVVAERVLARVFRNVQIMPHGNPGYDFICGGGYMVDVKSSCRHHCEKGADSWIFKINKNLVAEYFLVIAFDNRNNLNPEHVWLIPGGDVNDHVNIRISETMLDKWNVYKLDVGRVTACCNTMKGEGRAL